MSEFWKELKDEVEDAVYQCKFCAKKEVQKRGSYSCFCEKRWLPCAHVIARGQCDMMNRGEETEDVGKSDTDETDDIIKDIVQKQDEWLMEAVCRVGFNIDKYELMKALNYDRHQYEQGYSDGIRARDDEIVRCKDCVHFMKLSDYSLCVAHGSDAVDADDFCSWAERKETEDAVH